MRTGLSHRSFVGISLTLLIALTAHAQPGPAPDYDFDWVTIGDVNNPAYSGPPGPDGSYPVGRGSVPHAYRMARTEVTTSQWVEFMNTFTTQPGIDAFSREWSSPAKWGAFPYSNPSGPGIVYRIENYPEAAQQAVAGISWRQAARFCNWIHNGKSSDPASLVTGAYDTTTWSGGPGTGMPATDAERHLPGAKFWIPSIDEWLKAAHYDPDKNGPGAGGWWQQPNASNEPLIPGLPGVGTTSATTGQWRLRVGSYPDVQSAYGLLDVSGGAAEWLEDIFEQKGSRYLRFVEGTSTTDALGINLGLDQILRYGASDATSGNTYEGFRLASVPNPPTMILAFLGGGWVIMRKRRK